MDQNKTPLFDALKAYDEEKVTPFDVPGHKHGNGLPEMCDFLGKKVLEVDVNAMKCLDNLGNPVSVIAEAEELLANAYNGDYGFFLVNGTSAGVQAMIMSVCKPNEKLILPRNAHKSATNGLIASGSIPVYIQPDFDVENGFAVGVTKASVKKAIDENLDAKAVFIINPTYFGATADLKWIIDYAHEKNMIVIVDEAHGAHFHFNNKLPMSGMDAGADITAVSLHKTCGALTQASGLIMKGERIKPKYLRKIINLNQTTSASYLLMSSIDVARKNLAIKGQIMLDEVLDLAKYAKDEIEIIDGINLYTNDACNGDSIYDFDETKLVINVTGLGLTGFDVYDILRDEYAIQVELGESCVIMAILSIGDNMQSVKTLIDALKDISKKHYGKHKHLHHVEKPHGLEQIISPRDAFYADKEIIDLTKAAGRLSGESVMIYPPGIPAITPGEMITKEVVDYLLFIRESHTIITDVDDLSLDKIKVIR